MKVRRKEGVRIRQDAFGGVCYVPHRDDFFAANKQVFSILKLLQNAWMNVDAEWVPTFASLAKLGICETVEPTTAEVSYSGPSFLGEFPEIPTISEPLVLNCFCTAHCPLKCVYCHADDLMKQYRDAETEQDLENVAATASMVPAIVAVITGGDPLTRPDRAAFLIERLAGQKALVLDTSGAGDIDKLLPLLVKHKVHVRVSLDSLSSDNAKLRPANPEYISGHDASRIGAEHTINKCLEAGLPITVQTVVSSVNENEDDWRNLRDWLVYKGVRHWVLHVAVKGGSARRIENEAKKQKRKRGILPSSEVYPKLWRLVEEVINRQIPIDIRCTDTETSPNSVFLINSKGDLYTEGYAYNGKVHLFRAGEGRPDLVRALWPHIDRFGHAKRYLNWNKWFFDGESINNICYELPLPKQTDNNVSALVESESKFEVTDRELLDKLLRQSGFTPSETVWQRDEYFDNDAAAMASLDFVVRLRKDLESLIIGFKGPRFYTSEGEYSRIEIEVPAGPEPLVRSALSAIGLNTSWFFEKRRTEYRHKEIPVLVVIDEVPEAGYYTEIEGPLVKAREVQARLLPALGAKETRNYAELFIAFKEKQGLNKADIKGASFIVNNA